MPRQFVMPNVGARGRRRIVPMMGIDYIAGQIERKGSPIASRGDNSKPYGQKPPSIGGRTRVWSFINFLNVDSNMGRSTEVTSVEVATRTTFANAVKSMNATFRDLTKVGLINVDFKNGTIYGNLNPNNYATPRGWVMAIRFTMGAEPTDTSWPPVAP